MSLVLVRKHIGLAGFTGLLIALTYATLVRFALSDITLATLLGLVLNVMVAIPLSRVYSSLSGSPGSWGSVLEAFLAQVLSFLAFSAAFYNLLLTIS